MNLIYSYRLKQPRRFLANFSACSGARWQAVLTDIVLVAIWGATIPGLMWLGAAAGF